MYKTVNGPLPPFGGLNYLCFDYRLNFRSYQESKEIGQWTINLSKHMQLNNNKSFFVGYTFLVERLRHCWFVQPKKTYKFLSQQTTD